LAAYTAYKIGLAESDASKRSDALKEAAAEFETLIAKGQTSKETFYFLNGIYLATANVSARQTLAGKFSAAKSFDWKVDTSGVVPEDLAALNQVTAGAGGTVTVKAGDPIPAGQAGLTSALGTGPKYALIIGNSESRIPNAGLPFAGDDAQSIRDNIIASAGYSPDNIELVVNGTAQQMLASAQTLASRVVDGASVLIYYTGVGSNVDGRDYLAGVDTELANDTTTMLAKSELFSTFMAKGARVFSFFQANRAQVNGRVFGSEFPQVGSIAQVQATIPGAAIYSVVRNGKQTGIFTAAFNGVLAELKSSQIPIMEFGWQLFYKIRRGDTGTTGGSSRQIPTLPVLTNMGADSRF
jgi:hypothetical protein